MFQVKKKKSNGSICDIRNQLLKVMLPFNLASA